jgi:pimeloyl-ACP methyl ester carboxylesterase
MTTTHVLETAEVDIAYDVHGPLPTADGRPPLFMIGQPMDASGFTTLASYFPDRTVVTYDPRGLGRSTRKDGRVDNAPTVQADDVHAVIEALGVGPVEMFASSGGAVTALALVAAYPNDVTTLVAHEPPLIPVLPDAAAAERAQAGVRDAYEAQGSGAGMAAFIAMTSWQGEFTDDYFAQPAPDPARFGMPTEDDGSRDDPLLSDRSWAVSSYRPDFDALSRAPTRIVIAVGEESLGTFTGRTAMATSRAARSRGDCVPEPPWRLPRRRVRLRRATRGLRAETARRPRRRHAMPCLGDASKAPAELGMGLSSGARRPSSADQSAPRADQVCRAPATRRHPRREARSGGGRARNP